MLKKIKNAIASISKKDVLRFIINVLSTIGLFGIVLIFGILTYKLHVLALGLYISVLALGLAWVLDQEV